MNHKKLGLTFLIAFLIISNSINSIPLFSQIRVMPLGDATVIGTGSTNNVGGFRDDLHLFLNAGLMPFDFVGTQNDGVSTDLTTKVMLLRLLMISIRIYYQQLNSINHIF